MLELHFGRDTMIFATVVTHAILITAALLFVGLRTGFIRIVD